MDRNNQDLVVGALVKWTEAKTCGIITDIDERVIRVRWDDKGQNLPPQFASKEPPLQRVEVMGAVQRRSTGETLIAQAPVQVSPPTWQCLSFDNSGVPARVNVPEADLRPPPVNDPIERFRQKLIGSLTQYRLQEVTRWYRFQHQHNDLVSLGNVLVDIKPHQVSVVHRVVTHYPHRFLLCDEVGLGKTIEAGMVLKELRTKGGAQRVLIIVPAGLVRQWQFEMKSKFNESFSVLATSTVRYLEQQDRTSNPFTRFDSVLCSASWIAQKKWAALCAEVDWDLVIVDEAHHARSRRAGNKVTTTRLYRLVRELAAHEHLAHRGMLFLTATPLQLSAHELYSLVELLDPALFPSEEAFAKHCDALPGLNRLAERLQRHEFPLADEDPEETVTQVSQWLERDEEAIRPRLCAGEEGRQALANDLAERHLLSQVLIRNRKAIVGGFMPRVANRWEVELTAEERVALLAIEAYVQDGFRRSDRINDNAVGFTMVIFQKLMASSIAAIKASLSKRRESLSEVSARAQRSLNDAMLEESLEDDNNAGDIVGLPGPAGEASEELRLLDQAMEALERVKHDSKARVLIERLSDLFADHPEDKVIVFTEFRETQRHLEAELANRGWDVHLFHGQMNPAEKDRAVERFRNDAGPQILISTQAGGEGRNFQFCHLLVNYDLPWNPMKIEQRIGRVDRIGQQEVVRIFNLWVKDTIEERILDVLEKRIQVFEKTVGGLDPILGGTENDIREIMRTSAEKRKAALEELERRLEGQVRQAREAERKLGDFIMDTKSYRRELAERIAGQPSPINNNDLERFIGQLLAGAGTSIRQTDGIYTLLFRGELLDTHKVQFVNGPKRKAVFRPDQRPDSEEIEFMAFGHPIIEAIVEQVLSQDYEGATGTRQMLADEDLAPTQGWLFTYHFTRPGPQSDELILPVYVSDEGEVDVETGHRLVARACRFDNAETDIEIDEIPGNLAEIAEAASQFANDQKEQMQRSAEEQATKQVDREVARLEAWFDYRELTAQDRLQATHVTVDQLRRSEDEIQRRILPVWEANLRRDEDLLTKLARDRRNRIAEVEKYRHPQVAWSLKALGRIQVVAAEP